MPELHGKVALVTGGGAGLGAAICETLAESGATVVAADLREAMAAALARRLSPRGKAFAMQLDVANPEQAQQAVAQIVAEHGRLDVVVNNAGIDVTLPVEDLSIENWDCVLRTNLFGPFYLSKYAMLVMRRQKEGQIINIASTAARRAWPNASAYHASKWGLLGLSHALHAEARQHNVKVTAVICGGMRTAFLLERFPDIDVSTLQDPHNVAEVIRSLLMLPAETVVPEVMVLPMRETSWP